MHGGAQRDEYGCGTGEKKEGGNERNGRLPEASAMGSRSHGWGIPHNLATSGMTRGVQRTDRGKV
ncbi:MAG: hypothetical protein Dbin4_01518 [Alphaproteobacteria bacterium]|nr:hypothetical protein [Alphaproteobacteria bacterium]